MPEVVKEQPKIDKEAAPAVRSTAVDKMGNVEVAVTEMVADEPAEDLDTMLRVENVCMGCSLPSGLQFWWIVATAVCGLVRATTMLPTATKGAAFCLGRVDGAMPRTASASTVLFGKFCLRQHSGLRIPTRACGRHKQRTTLSDSKFCLWAGCRRMSNNREPYIKQENSGGCRAGLAGGNLYGSVYEGLALTEQDDE